MTYHIMKTYPDGQTARCQTASTFAEISEKFLEIKAFRKLTGTVIEPDPTSFVVDGTTYAIQEVES